MRRIAVVTVGRSDFGIYAPVLRAIEDDPSLRLQLIVGGAHLTGQFGWTVNEITAQGFEISDKVDMLLSADTPAAVATSMGLGTMGFARSYARLDPDIIIVLGDRFEMHAAASAAVPLGIPLAHIHGGEVTEGAIDEAFRHAITKYSHLHFVSTEQYARRVIQMGEEPWRVTVGGAPGLDNLRTLSLPDRQELEERVGLELSQPPLLVTYHPATLERDNTESQMQNLLGALNEVDCPIVFTYPNADAQGGLILKMIREFLSRHPAARVVDNLGTRAYFGMMNQAAAMVGNSSSGIVEAASFRLPVVNVGERQRGRYHERNVIDVGYSREEILQGIVEALSPSFRDGLTDLVNPYGDGNAAERIVDRLRTVPLDERILRKKFCDLSSVDAYKDAA